MPDSATRSGASRPNGGAPPDGDERAEPFVDDWQWDWVEGSEQAGEHARPASEPPRSSRTGLIPEGGAATEQEAAHARHLARTRRRRLVALVALGLPLVLAVVIPLVVFGGSGSRVEQTTATTTATGQATSPERRTTTITTTTTTRQSKSSRTTLLHISLPQAGSLHRGDRGSVVEQLQRGLAALGFASGTPDGIFGSTTEAAVIDFQRSNNLAPDGIVGTDTARLLNSALAKRGVAK
jgi:hypothetical protein